MISVNCLRIFLDHSHSSCRRRKLPSRANVLGEDEELDLDMFPDSQTSTIPKTQVLGLLFSQGDQGAFLATEWTERYGKDGDGFPGAGQSESESLIEGSPGVDTGFECAIP